MQRRIFVHLLGISFLAITVITAIAAYHIRAGTIRYHAETFSKIAEEVHHNMGRLLAGAVSDAALIANDPLFRNGAIDPRAVEQELQNIHNILPHYDDISLIAPNGTVIASTSYRFLADWRHKKHFQESLQGIVAASPVGISSEPFRQFLQFTAPVSQNGSVKAVIALQLDLAKLAEIPLGVHIGETGRAFVTDHEGNIIIHHDPRRILEPAPVEFVSAGRTDGVIFTENGASFFGSVFFPPFQDTIFPAEIPPWRIIIAERSDELLSAVRTPILQAILLAAVIFVIAALVSLHLARRIVRPLKELTAAIADISGTELAVSLPPPTNDEIGALSRAFLRLLEDLRESRALLVSSERRYREMADLLPLPLFEADIAGKIRYVNRVAFETFGYSEEDIARGVSMFEVLVPEDRPRAVKNVESRLNGTLVSRMEYTARRKDGITLPVMVYNAPFHEHERVAGFRGVVIDLSPIREAEEELSHKEQQLMQAQKMESIGTLVGGLAHDFNNVLGGIGATSSLLTYMNTHDPAAVTPEKLRESLGLIDDQVKRASEMIRKLLTLSRRQKISFSPMDLVRSAQNVAVIAEKTLDKSVRLRLSLPATPALINGDAALIEQVLLNLVLNAWHAMTTMRGEHETPGGICAITLERTDIGDGFPNWPPDLPVGPYWSLRVTDTGVGIPAADLQTVFDPFFTTKKRSGGSGLGLPMAYTIIQQHHGAITLSSIVGSGTTVTAYLPVLAEPGSADDDAPAFTPHRGSGTVLCADDEPTIRETVKEMLTLMGYEVLTAADGEEAVTLFRRYADRISFLVLDIIMPQRSGIEALRDIRQIRPQIRALLISGYRFEEPTQEAVSWGGVATLAKPFSFEQFAEAIRALTS